MRTTLKSLVLAAAFLALVAGLAMAPIAAALAWPPGPY
jgi:hypothetical protein